MSTMWHKTVVFMASKMSCWEHIYSQLKLGNLLCFFSGPATEMICSFQAIILRWYLTHARVTEGAASNTKIFPHSHHHPSCQTETRFPSFGHIVSNALHLSPLHEDCPQLKKVASPKVMSPSWCSCASNDWSISVVPNEQPTCFNSGQLCRANLAPGRLVWYSEFLSF